MRQSIFASFQPYVGILIDSFREAISNKILWALLITSTFLLAAMAPFGLVLERNFQFGTYDVYDHDRLIRKLGRALDRKSQTGVGAIAAKLSPEFSEKIRREAREHDGSAGIRQLVEQLNRLTTLPGLYSESAFPTAAKRERLKPLIEQLATGISAADLQQLNSELLQITLSPELGASRGEQLWLGYAGFKIGDPIPITRRQIETYVEPLMLSLVVQFGLGVIIVFVAIIVTSPMIPDTFRSGALHLLLSKPISRSWLFLSKFAGGCIFVTLNLVYVLLGLYLIVGFRFGIWNEGLIGCIPLLLFVYAIFYCVSALTGLIWGNAIVSVVACLVFWVFCFAVGTMHDILQDRVQRWPLIQRIDQIADETIAVNESGVVSVWNDEFSVWQPATEFSIRAEGSTSITFGPYFDDVRKQLIVKTFRHRNPFDSVLNPRSRSLTLVRLEEQTSTRPKTLDESRETAFWDTLPGPDIPEQVFRIVGLERDLIVVSRLGLYRLGFDRVDVSTQGTQPLFGLLGRNSFEEVTPRGFRMTDNATAAHAGNNELLLYTSGTLSRMSIESGRFKILSQTKLDGDGSEAALLAGNHQFTLVARDDKPTQIMDATLKSIAEVDLPDNEVPKQFVWVPGSDYELSIVTHSGKLMKLDCRHLSIEEIATPIQQKLTCVTWLDPHRAWLGVAPNQACLVDLRQGTIQRRLTPALKTSEKFFYRLVQPLYRYNPKPSAINQSMQYLLTGSTSFDPNVIPFKLDSAKAELDVWGPIISNSIFVLVVLAAACTYVAWKEY